MEVFDQVSILIKAKNSFNHDRILLSPRAREELYSTFGVKTDALENSVWIESINHSIGLIWPKSIQTGIMEVNSRTVETSTIAEFCSMMRRSQRFSNMELDSIETVWSQGVLQEFQKSENDKTVMNEIKELILVPSGSKMSSEKLQCSFLKPEISDSGVYSYDEMVRVHLSSMTLMNLNLIFLLWRQSLNLIINLFLTCVPGLT